MNQIYYNLFLDDMRNPADVTWIVLPLVQWMVARNYDQFVNCIKQNGLPARISFDHDLAEEHYRVSMYDSDKHYNKYYSDGTFKEKTGYECAKFIADYCVHNNVPIPEYYVHTMNPIGKQNIISILESARKVITI